mmetsp:Transcript_6403/g.8563  ORF Transcript_6403/g.8563 Transcript_6403/m.8563 type:complete len:93 (-) Transcript_6403:2967-3245(-)
MHVTVGLHAAPVPKDPRLLVRLVRLVIPVQRNSQSLFTLTHLADKHCARVANVCAENFGSHNEDRYTGGAAKAQVDLGVAEESILDHAEALV